VLPSSVTDAVTVTQPAMLTPPLPSGFALPLLPTSSLKALLALHLLQAQPTMSVLVLPLAPQVPPQRARLLLVPSSLLDHVLPTVTARLDAVLRRSRLAAQFLHSPTKQPTVSVELLSLAWTEVPLLRLLPLPPLLLLLLAPQVPPQRARVLLVPSSLLDHVPPTVTARLDAVLRRSRLAAQFLHSPTKQPTVSVELLSLAWTEVLLLRLLPLPPLLLLLPTTLEPDLPPEAVALAVLSSSLDLALLTMTVSLDAALRPS